ncbi:neurturin [Trichomycterus rosablanca]|uniref:neurturin n=1 Tax=Trichomycterus rosablanca TaxID=2290929 RepID=UPI002F35024C
MKLWKRAIIAVVLLSLGLSLLLAMIVIPAGSFNPWSSTASLIQNPSSTAQAPAPLSSSSSPKPLGLRRVARSTDDMGSLLSDFSYLFQSFTESELEKVIGSLVDRKVGRRTKREKRDRDECSLHEVVLTVSELGLGYESDETVHFRYCSGRCTVTRRNYDLVLEHMRLNDASGDRGCPTDEGRSKRERGRYSPCCRPTKYEKNMSFLDNKSKFYTIRNVTAKKCGCV